MPFSLLSAQENETTDSNKKEIKSTPQIETVQNKPSTNTPTTQPVVNSQVLQSDKTIKNKQEKTPDFIPSEAISEDLVVSFPVDI